MLNVQPHDGVTLVELEHGPVNALDLDLCEAITAAFGKVQGPVVLTGSGRSFSAGVDLRQVVEGGPDYVDRFLRALSVSLAAVFTYPAPTVAAVNGHAVAGGCLLALACDARLMSAGKIGLTEVSVGVSFPPVALGIARHTLGVGIDRAVLRAELVDTNEAHRIGMVDELVDADVLRDEAQRRAVRLGAHPPAAYREAKLALRRPVLAAAADGDQAAVIAQWNSSETQALLAAQLEALKKR